MSNNPVFDWWTTTPEYWEWLGCFTGAERMKLQYNTKEKIDFSWIYQGYDPLTYKIDALELIHRHAQNSKFPWIKLKHLITGTFRLGSTEVGQFEGNIPLIRTTDMVTPTTLNLDTILYVSTCLDEQLLQDGDLLFVNKGSVKKIYFHNSELYPGKYTFFKNQNRARFDGDKMLPKFGYYFTQSANFLDFVEVSSSTTTVPGVNSTKYANMLMPVPLLETQNKIVTFLDNEVEFIDSIIKRSEALTDRLVEFKGSLITSAVCGEIPIEQLENLDDEQWVESILSDPELSAKIDSPKESYLITGISRRTINSNFETRFDNYDPKTDKLSSTVALDKLHADSLFPWKQLKSLIADIIIYGHPVPGKLSGNTRLLKVGDIDSNRKIKTKTMLYYWDVDDERRMLNHGDVLLGFKGSVGKSFFFDEDLEEGKFTFNNNWVRARLNKHKINPKFFYYFTLTSNYWNWVSSDFTMTTLPGLSASKYSRLFVPVPDLSTQQRIIDFLDKKIPQIDNLIAKLTELKNLQSEYRLSLISHAVTGMIDVDEFSAEHASNWEARKRHLESQEEIVATQRQKRGKALRINSMEKEKSYGEVFPWWEIVVDMIDSGEAKGLTKEATVKSTNN